MAKILGINGKQIEGDCKFCTLQGKLENLPDVVFHSEETITCREITIMSLGCNGQIDPRKKTLNVTVWFDGADDDLIFKNVPINFCPICGRKL